ncbi:hypothetical protein [Selenomonas ruminantium]|uniref:hypothetical protein n=1 Tax=Selenomonas ruminantium TaxID=971 RepID=UPI0026EAA6B6|nr:hypothetical protein [Selenomonas ruminantium]
MPKREFHQPHNYNIFDLSIPYSGKEVHRYLRLSSEPKQGLINGKLYTVPIKTIPTNDIEELYCCGDISIDPSTDSIDYHNYRIDKHLSSGPIVDAVKKSYIEQKESLNFKEYYGYDLSSDFTKKAYQSFSKDLNQMLKYASDKSMRIIEDFEVLSYGVMFHHNNGNIKDYVLKTKTNKDVLIARVVRKKAYKNFKGSVSIILPQKPLAYITKAYNEELMNFTYDNSGNSYTLLNDADFLYNFYFQQRERTPIESNITNNKDVDLLIQSDKHLLDSIDKYYDNTFSRHITGIFKDLYNCKYLFEDIDNSPFYSLKGSAKILASNPNALLYSKLASEFLLDTKKFTSLYEIDDRKVCEFLRSESPDKIIAAKMLDQNVPAYAVANTIHHFSPWQAIRQDVFADNSKSVNLVKEVLSQSKSVSKSLYKEK